MSQFFLPTEGIARFFGSQREIEFVVCKVCCSWLVSMQQWDLHCKEFQLIQRILESCNYYCLNRLTVQNGLNSHRKLNVI